MQRYQSKLHYQHSPFNAIQCVPDDFYSSRFITYAPCFISGKLFPEETFLDFKIS